MPNIQPSYNLNDNEHYIINDNGYYTYIGNKENYDKECILFDVNKFDYIPYPFSVDYDKEGNADTEYVIQNDNNEMQYQDWDGDESIKEYLPLIWQNHNETFDNDNIHILPDIPASKNGLDNNEDDEMWDAHDIPTIYKTRTPDEDKYYKKRYRYEIKRNKQGLKRLLSLKKKVVKSYFTIQHPEQQQTFDELLKIGVHSNDIYLLQNACRKYKYENFYQMMQSRNIYHYGEKHEFRDKRVKQQRQNLTTQKIKLTLSQPTEKLLRVLLGLTIFKYIDFSHEKAINYGLKIKNEHEPELEHEHDQLLKNFYANKYLFKQISTQLFEYYSTDSYKLGYMGFLKKYHLTESILINSQNDVI